MSFPVVLGADAVHRLDDTVIVKALSYLLGDKNRTADGIQKPIEWYLDNRDWWQTIISGEFQNYYEKMYANR